jgi:hypothetical protein
MYSRFNKNGNLQISNPDEVEKLFKKCGTYPVRNKTLAGIVSIHGFLLSEHLLGGSGAVFSWDSRNYRIGVFPNVIWFNKNEHSNGLFIQGFPKHMMYANELSDLSYVMRNVEADIRKHIFDDLNKEIEKQLEVLA